jgi:hypothetical protein
VTSTDGAAVAKKVTLTAACFDTWRPEPPNPLPVHYIWVLDEGVHADEIVLKHEEDEGMCAPPDYSSTPIPDATLPQNAASGSPTNNAHSAGIAASMGPGCPGGGSGGGGSGGGDGSGGGELMCWYWDYYDSNGTLLYSEIAWCEVWAT